MILKKKKEKKNVRKGRKATEMDLNFVLNFMLCEMLARKNHCADKAVRISIGRSVRH